MRETRIIPSATHSVFLYPGALEVGSRGESIHTILGSCVAVCLYDKTHKSGGLNHYMLPFWNGDGLATPKYGNIAIRKLAEAMQNLGSRREQLIAKVFGGAEVLSAHNHSFNIGQKNINLAFEILQELRIPVVAQSVGGKLGRKIVFNTTSGEIVQRYVKSSDLQND